MKLDKMIQAVSEIEVAYRALQSAASELPFGSDLSTKAVKLLGQIRELELNVMKNTVYIHDMEENKE